MAISVEVVNEKLAHLTKEERLELALKKLKRKVKKSNILVDLYEKREFMKPSVKKRLKKLKAIARERYRIREQKSQLDGR